VDEADINSSLAISEWTGRNARTTGFARGNL